MKLYEIFPWWPLWPDNRLILRLPSQAANLLDERYRLDEGIWKKWDNNYSYRVDLRPDSQGGPQIHIRRRDGGEWAYRHTGDRSEPSKYTLAANDLVRTIVRDRLSVPAEKVIEFTVISVGSRQCVAEVRVLG